MTLHEECLLKYLLNPLDLLHTTNLLKFNNMLLEQGVDIPKIAVKETPTNA